MRKTIVALLVSGTLLINPLSIAKAQNQTLADQYDPYYFGTNSDKNAEYLQSFPREKDGKVLPEGTIFSLERNGGMRPYPNLFLSVDSSTGYVELTDKNGPYNSQYFLKVEVRYPDGSIDRAPVVLTKRLSLAMQYDFDFPNAVIRPTETLVLLKDLREDFPEGTVARIDHSNWNVLTQRWPEALELGWIAKADSIEGSFEVTAPLVPWDESWIKDINFPENTIGVPVVVDFPDGSQTKKTVLISENTSPESPLFPGTSPKENSSSFLLSS